MRVNIHEAKSTLSKLVAGVEDTGGEVTLCRAGRPAAKIVQIERDKTLYARRIGILAGKIDVSDDFDAHLPSDAAIFGIKAGL